VTSLTSIAKRYYYAIFSGSAGVSKDFAEQFTEC
jgi:hypothetical protein